MLAFQRKKMANDLYYEVLAHTDYDESVDVELAMLCKIRNKPPHAGIGATQIYDLFNKEDDEVARAAACAIMKHHSVDTESVEVYEISRKYLTDLSRLLKELSIKCPSFNLKGRKESLKDIVPEKDKEWLTYLFFVRILRLCDQKATALIEKYYQPEPIPSYWKLTDWQIHSIRFLMLWAFLMLIFLLLIRVCTTK